MQVNRKVGNSTPDPAKKTLDRSSPKFAWVIMSWTPTIRQNFIKIRLPPFAPQIRENAPPVTRLVFCTSVSLQPRLLHRFSRSVRQMTSFRARMCLLGAPKTEILHFDPIFLTKKRIFGQFSTGLNRF